jgi:drug/metabolite transporter (DMT)-like permease
MVRDRHATRRFVNPPGRPILLRIDVLIGFVAMIFVTVTANLVLRTGALVPASERAIFGILGWKSLLGLALFGIAGLIYAVVLRWVPLNVAQAFTAAQYVGVVLAASFVLGEPISPLRWTGILCIGLGIVIVGFTVRS